MTAEYMVFEARYYEVREEKALVVVTMPNLNALMAFVHMASVDNRPIPTFKCKRTEDWIYFCLYEGCIVRAFVDLTPEELNGKEAKTDVGEHKDV